MVQNAKQQKVGRSYGIPVYTVYRSTYVQSTERTERLKAGNMAENPLFFPVALFRMKGWRREGDTKRRC